MTTLSDASFSKPAESAVLLTNNPVIRPWYREPWPWLLAAIPCATVVASAVTFWMAISTEDGLVADDYYKRGLAINRDIAREQAAERLGVSVRLRFAAADGRVTAFLPPGTPQPAALILRFAHPTRSGLDMTARLEPAAPNSYAGALRLAPASHWRVSVEDPDGVWRLAGTWEASVPEVALRAARQPE